MTQDELKKELDYNPETGAFTRVYSKGGKKAGSVVGSLDQSSGYLYATVNFKRIACHRLAFIWMTGEVPDNVDHINGVRDDNRWANLRNVSSQGNSRNRKPSSSTGVLGVYKDPRCLLPYFASVQVMGKTHNSTGFRTLEEAVAARKELELKYFQGDYHGMRKTQRRRQEAAAQGGLKWLAKQVTKLG